MAAVFQEVTLGWGGEEYSITPTMRLLNKIEQDISLSQLAHRMYQGDVPMSHLASVIAIFLQSAGAKATDEEVYQELMTGDPEAVQEMAGAIMMAVFPQPKKSAAPSTAKAAPAKRSKAKS